MWLLRLLFLHLSLNRKNKLSPFCLHSLTSCHPFILVCLPYARLCSFAQHMFIWGRHSTGLWVFSGRSFQRGANYYTSYWVAPTWVRARRAVHRYLWLGMLTCLRVSGNYLSQGYCKTYQSKRNSLSEDCEPGRTRRRSEKQGPKAWGREGGSGRRRQRGRLAM